MRHRILNRILSWRIFFTDLERKILHPRIATHDTLVHYGSYGIRLVPRLDPIIDLLHSNKSSGFE